MEQDEIDQESVVIDVLDLHNAFKADMNAADKLYWGKRITLKGFVLYAGPDIYTLPSINLSDKPGGNYYVICVLPFVDYPRLIGVKKDTEVMILGEYMHYMEEKDLIVIKRCKIVSK